MLKDKMDGILKDLDRPKLTDEDYERLCKLEKEHAVKVLHALQEFDKEKKLSSVWYRDNPEGWVYAKAYGEALLSFIVSYYVLEGPGLNALHLTYLKIISEIAGVMKDGKIYGKECKCNSNGDNECCGGDCTCNCSKDEE